MAAKLRGVLIGINYTGTDSELRGCINDVNDVRSYLARKSFDEIATLTDETPMKPTRDNIISILRQYVGKSSAGDTLYVHYSGHGSYLLDTAGDENDLRDECICPLDYENGVITDDELYQLLVKNLPAGVKLRVVFDSCHSGSCLDLQYRYDSKVVRENANVSGADVLFISGCRDNQTSADSSFDGKYNGALTWALLGCLRGGGSDRTWKQLVAAMRKLLKTAGYPQQVPQLDACSADHFDSVVDI